MVKVRSLEPSTIFTHDNALYMRVDADFPFNAVKLATGELVRLAGERVEAVAQWNELHTEIIEMQRGVKW